MVVPIRVRQVDRRRVRPPGEQVTELGRVHLGRGGKVLLLLLRLLPPSPEQRGAHTHYKVQCCGRFQKDAAH